jgi:hypothetical protein
MMAWIQAETSHLLYIAACIVHDGLLNKYAYCLEHYGDVSPKYVWNTTAMYHQNMFSHDRSKLSSSSFSGITFQDFPNIPDLFFEVSYFQHLKKQCSECSALLFYFLNLSLICW